MSELHFLDGTRNGVLDLRIGGALNPFHQCRRQLAKKIDGGRTGLLKPLYSALDEARWTHLDDMVREMVVTFSLQVPWRFAALFEFPFEFPQLLRPGITVQEQLDLLADFFERDDCCHDDLFGLRVRETHRSPQHLLDDVPFIDLLKAWTLF